MLLMKTKIFPGATDEEDEEGEEGTAGSMLVLGSLLYNLGNDWRGG